ncbi:MAG: FtsH protease activity modulator HflK [Pseudomonadota bacterium]
MSDDDDKKPNNKKGKNPWGNTKGNARGSSKGKSQRPRSSEHNSGGRYHSSHHNNDPIDINDAIRRAKNDLNGMLPGNLGGGAMGAIIGLLLLIAIIPLCAFIVKPGEQAVVQRFGAWDRTQSQEGLSFKLPWPIETVTTVNVNEIRKMNIGFVESFGRGNAGARDIPEESLMLTSDRNIVDVDLVIQWNIKSAEEFLFNINDQVNTIKKVAESAIREEVGQTNMFPIITTDRDSVAQQTKEIIQTNLDEYKSGVNITQVLIQRAEVHPEVQQAFQDVQSAKQDAEDVQNRARAYREDILPKARGEAIQRVQAAEAYKQSTVARAEGDADRFNSIYQSYLTGEDVTKTRIYLETMETVLQNAQKIILDSGDGQNGVVPYLPLDQLRPAAGTPSNNQRTGN